MDARLPSGTVTFLTTDIVGYSALFELDPDLARAQTFKHFELIEQIVTEHGGTVFQMVGDATWAAFTIAQAAAKCSLAISAALRKSPEVSQLRLRIALLTGEATPVGGNYQDRVLNRCSRLCSKCDGDQILVGGSTYELTRSDFNYFPLGEIELRGVPSESVWELRQMGETATKHQPAPLPSGRRRGSLPEDERAFIGRERELAELRQLLNDPKVRLITVTGMGGIGKTRLCTEVSREAELQFQGGVCMIPCDAIKGPEELLAAIASVTDSDRETLSVEHVAGAVGDAKLLLVLDCFERLVECRSLIEGLLRNTQRLKMLVSSRAVLGLPREYEFALGPMALQATGGHVPDAAALFWDVAEHVSPKLRATKAHSRTANQIVTALEGVPLAILLAATRLSHMSLEELLEQVQSRRLKTLKRAPVEANDRHETLTRVISDSFQLLGQSEIQLMVDLACFQGFYMEDALAILGAEDEVRDGIAHLRNSSLVTAQTLGARMRFRILDTVREYIRDQLADAIRPEVKSNHADHYTRRAIEMRTDAASGDWKRANALLWLEMGNFREAIRSAADSGDSLQLEDQARSLARPLAEAGLRAEFEVLRNAVKRREGFIALDALAELEGLEGMLERRAGNTQFAFAAWRRCAELWREFGDTERQADVLVDFCDAALSDGNIEAAKGALDEYDVLCGSAAKSENILACGRILHARVALAAGDQQGATVFAGEGWSIAEHMQPDHNAIFVVGGLGEIYYAVGDLETSESLYYRALQIAVEANYADSTRRLLLDLADLYRARPHAEKEVICLTIVSKLPPPAKDEARQSLRKRVEETRARFGMDAFLQVQQQMAPGTWNESVKNLSAESP